MPSQGRRRRRSVGILVSVCSRPCGHRDAQSDDSLPQGALRDPFKGARRPRGRAARSEPASRFLTQGGRAFG